MNTRIAICLTSHDRIDCTRINQEIFKLNFAHPYIITHASSGKRAEPYLEDVFVPCVALPHPAGAINLMKRSIEAALPFEPDYLVILDGDTWLLDEQVLLGLIQLLNANLQLLMATTSWTSPRRSLFHRLALEFFDLIRVREDRLVRFASLPRRMIYDAEDFSTQFLILRNQKSLIESFCGLSADNRRSVERQWFDRYAARFNLKHVLRMVEREPVHPDHRHICEPLGLFSQHWPAVGTFEDPGHEGTHSKTMACFPGKREVLESYPHICHGEAIRRLLNAKDIESLDYYNEGAQRC